MDFRNNNTNKKLISGLALAYANSKKVLAERSNYNTVLGRAKIKDSESIVNKIEYVTKEKLSEDDYYIIYNEVILGKKGPWYEGISNSTYYRHKINAYSNFLSCLAK